MQLRGYNVTSYMIFFSGSLFLCQVFDYIAAHQIIVEEVKIDIRTLINCTSAKTFHLRKIDHLENTENTSKIQ